MMDYRKRVLTEQHGVTVTLRELHGADGQPVDPAGPPEWYVERAASAAMGAGLTRITLTWPEPDMAMAEEFCADCGRALNCSWDYHGLCHDCGARRAVAS